MYVCVFMPVVYCTLICDYVHVQYMYLPTDSMYTRFMFVHVCIYLLFLCLSVRRVDRIGVRGLFDLCECVRLSQG